MRWVVMKDCVSQDLMKTLGAGSIAQWQSTDMGIGYNLQHQNKIKSACYLAYLGAILTFLTLAITDWVSLCST